MIHDCIGNEIEIGQLVQLVFPKGDIQFAKVMSVDHGGSPELHPSPATINKIKPAVVELEFARITLKAQPGGNIPILTVVKDPKITSSAS